MVFSVHYLSMRGVMAVSARDVMTILHGGARGGGGETGGGGRGHGGGGTGAPIVVSAVWVWHLQKGGGGGLGGELASETVHTGRLASASLGV